MTAGLRLRRPRPTQDPASTAYGLATGRTTPMTVLPSGGDAGSGGCTPTLARREEFSVCVTGTVRIPFLSEFVDANTATD